MRVDSLFVSAQLLSNYRGFARNTANRLRVRGAALRSPGLRQSLDYLWSRV